MAHQVLSPAFGVLLILGLGLALGSVQLIPLYEVARASFRQDAVTLSDVLGWAYPKRRLITFFIPNFFGNPTHRTVFDVFSGETVHAAQNAYGGSVTSFDWGLKNYVEGGAYVGILPLMVAVIAILRPPGLVGKLYERADSFVRRVKRALLTWLRGPYVPFFTVLSLFSLACIFGTPLYALVYALPFLNQSHSPFRWVFPLTVAVSALAGLGVRSIGRQESGSPDDRAIREIRIIRRIRDSDVPRGPHPQLPRDLGGSAVIAGVLASRLVFDHIEPLVTRVFLSLANAANVFPDARTFYSYLLPWVLIFAAFLLAGGVVLWLSRRPIRLPGAPGRIPLWQPLGAAVILADLLVFGIGFNPAVDPALLDYRPPVVDFLMQDTGLWRFSTFDPHGKNTFLANIGMFYGFQDVRGYDSLFSAQYARYMGWIEPQDQLPYNRIAPFRAFSSLDSPLTDMLNVKFVVTEEEIPLPKYRQVYQDGAVRVYENLGVAPRAFTLPLTATVAVPDVAAVGAAVMSYDPRYYAIVETDGAGWTGPSDAVALPTDTAAQVGAPSTQSVTSYGINEVEVDVTVGTPSWLILTDSFAPGWKAFTRPIGTGQDRETEVPIARVAGNFRGVQLDQSATVRFKYTPNSVKFGAFASFLGAMVVLFLTVVWTWRLVYRDRDDRSTVQRLAKNSIVPISLTLFNRAVDFAFAALMMRILGPTSAGEYYYATKIFVWFDILTNFGLNTYLTREVSRDRAHARRYLLNTTLIRLGLSVAAVPILLGFLGVRQTIIAGVTAPASSQVVLAIVLLYMGLIPSSLSTGLTALFYAYEKAEHPAAITSVTTMVKVTVQTLALLLGWGIIGLAGASIFVNLVTLTILGVLAWRLFPALRHPPADTVPLRSAKARHARREMVRDSWPLMLNHLLATLFFTVDVFLMEPILGAEAVGFYSIGGKLVDALMVIPSMFTMALFPVISRQAHGDREAMTRFYRLGTKILVLLALPAALISTVAAREMVLLLGGAQYLPGAVRSLQIMAWLMPISWINGITQYVLIALDKQRYLTRAYALGFAFSLVSNLFLMPRLGYQGSAALHILSEAVLFVPFYIGVRRYLGEVGWRQILIKPLLAAGVTAAGAMLLTTKVGSAAGLIAVVVVYPLLILALRAFTPEERSLLAPLFRRRGAAPGNFTEVPEPSQG